VAQRPVGAEEAEGMGDILRPVDVLTPLRRAHDAVEPHEVYYSLRGMRLRKVTPTTVGVVRWCIAIQAAGLPITTDLLLHLTRMSHSSLLWILHRLGDARILTLIRDGRRFLRYILYPEFKHRLEDRGVLDRCCAAFRLEAPLEAGD